MTLKKRCPIRTTLSKILPVKRIRELAEKMGAVTRQRKVDVVSLVAVLVLGGRWSEWTTTHAGVAAAQL